MLKPLDDFYACAGMRDGHRNDCKTCNLAAKHARYVANPEPAKERTRRWREENPNLYREAQERFRASGGKAIADRRSHLKRKHGITLQDYERMLADQTGTCAICGRAPRSDISLHVDHDHETGRIRGLLCFKCNNALGDFEDHPEWLDRAASYLSRDPELEPLIRNRVAELVASRTN